ncbi:C25 family cysteine peptidase [Dyadobacter fermentans]|uniref:putative type IX secretion system sortase PorU2 n=1 Tax=Dyadobacter fermentans TaxID=94254 RepID=UPI001CC13A21|nr:C25 family cysteine peptidase [Dyadobacter fermentans]MBZ1361322.1 T9SS type A sorting domain-containing protein [Dyadobacter fermentans]
MRFKNFTSRFGVLLLCFWLGASSVFSQKWSGANGNEWLAGKYGQQWVRIGVSAKGVHKVAISSLPAAFQSADKAKLQLWHRGVQVSILKADNTEILFYGVPNDGASDALLYRPSSSRVNPYFSTYSVESAYFLTIGTDNGLRAVAENTAVDTGIAAAQFHNQVEVKTFQTEYTHASVDSRRPATFNSYFEAGKTGTGTRLPIGTAATSPVYTANPASSWQAGSVATNFSFAAKNVYPGSIPKVKMLLSGRYKNAEVQIHVGKTSSSLRKVTTVSTSDFAPLQVSFDLNPALDYDANGGTFGFRSVIDGGLFSVSYYTVSYNQTIDVNNTNEFSFPAASAGSKSRIPISNPPASPLFYDISNADSPRVIQGSAANLMVTRNGSPLKLLVTTSAQSIDVLAAKISTVTFQDINPASYNYLIVASENLATSAQAFATYRQTESPGVKYAPLVVKIKDIYNQFNYGEPSPVAIRRFVDFMISDGNKSKYLLLLGKSISSPHRIVKELPGEVPTVGFPGSDLLLVDGLRGTAADVPAIPVGRVTALTDAEVNGYLEKVRKYEAQTNFAWRKNVMHISGGKTAGEVDRYAGYLSNVANAVTSSPFSGSVNQKVKTNPANFIEELNIATELNGTGLGMISYFGHAAPYRTDFNAGYVTDPAKGYNNTENYPVLFYNGCGVNNVFSNLFGASVNTSSSRPLSLDWLLAPGKGAVIVFGNTWDSYPTASDEYLDRLYPAIFSKSDSDRGTIGRILQDVALQTKTEKGYAYNPADTLWVTYYDRDRANVHQVLLQGDPALRILLNQALASTPTSNCVSLGDQCSGNSQEIRTYSITMSAAGSVPLRLTYKAHEGPSTGRIRINGGTWQTFNLAQTNIGQYLESTIGNYSLNAGSNTIEFASGGGYICFRELCAGVLPVASCTNLQDQCSGNSQEIRTYSINRSTAGASTFTLTYKAHEGPSVGRIRINGGTWQTFNLAQTAVGQYVEAPIGSYSLNAGNNTIEFASGTGYICFRQLCVGSSGARTNQDETSAEQAEGDQIITSPNPNDGNFDVRFYLEPGKAAVLTLLNQRGVELFSKRLIGKGQHVEHIQLNQGNSGLVLVQVRTQQRILTKKVILVK